VKTTLLGLLACVAVAQACATEAEAGPSRLWREGHGEPVVSGTFDPGKSLAPLIKALRPAVVSVRVSGGTPELRVDGFEFHAPPFFPFPDHPRAPNQRNKMMGTGSGFIVSKDGLVVTNHHVAAGRENIEVKLSDGRTFKAKLVGSDPQTDIALLRLEHANDLPTVVLGVSKRLEVGDWVIAIGSPMGLEQTVTVGIVSATGRGSLNLYRDGYADFIQTDAALGPGNSGGPLFNMNGEVVGINTAIDGMGRGLGFAIPVDQAKRVIPQLSDKGKVERGWLGITGRDEESNPGEAPRPGALVAEVHTGTPAQRSGLRAGDRIMKVEGEAIDDFSHLHARIGDLAPNTQVTLEVERGGKSQTIKTKLAERPSPDDLERLSGASHGRKPGKLFDGNQRRLGVSVSPVPGGVRIEAVEPGSIANELDLHVGDVIEEINERKVVSADELRKALEQNDRKVHAKFRRGNTTHVATLQRD